MIWIGHVARRGVIAYRVLLGNHEGKRPLGISRSRWDHIKMNIREMVWGSLRTEFIGLRTETNGGLL
jgi:hypothetical protein